jgi:hypothetical protein
MAEEIEVVFLNEGLPGPQGYAAEDVLEAGAEQVAAINALAASKTALLNSTATNAIVDFNSQADIKIEDLNAMSLALETAINDANDTIAAAQSVVDDAAAQVVLAEAQVALAEDQVALAAAQVVLAEAQNALATASRILAETARDAAISAYNSAQLASLTSGYYPDSRSLLPRGVAFGAVTGGSGYTNGGPYDLQWSGGNMEATPTGTFMVSGGAISSVTMTSPGRKIGTAAHTLPTASFAAAGGGTGGALALTSVSLIASGQYYWTDHATDSSLMILYSNVPVSGVPTATSQLTTLSKTGSASLIALTTPTGTANALVSSASVGTPVVSGGDNQLILLPIVTTNTGAVTLTVPGIGGGIARPIRATSGMSLLANSLIGGQFALLKYVTAAGVYFLIYPNNLSQNGRFAHVFRTVATTTNAIVTQTQYQNLLAYNINDLYMCPMAEANTSGTVTMAIDGVGSIPLMSATADLLPVPAWGANSTIFFRYRPDINKFILAFTNYTVSPSDPILPAKTPSYHVVGTTVDGDGSDNKLLVTPLTPLPNNTFADTQLHVRFPSDRPAEGGMLIKIVGFNDAEYYQLRDSNAVDQVAANRWKAGDTGVIARDPVTTYMYLVRVDLRTPAEVVETVSTSITEFYTSMNSRIYMLSSFGK